MLKYTWAREGWNSRKRTKITFTTLCEINMQVMPSINGRMPNTVRNELLVFLGAQN